jgi:hypothetical protein
MNFGASKFTLAHRHLGARWGYFKISAQGCRGTQDQNWTEPLSQRERLQ